MRIERIEYARFSLPLLRTHRVGGAAVDERRGLLVRLTSGTGHAGYGEISPLPGLHTETLVDAERILRDAGSGLAGREHADIDQLTQDLEDRVAAAAPGNAMSSPTVCLGLQTAGAALFAQGGQTTPAGVWSPTPRPTVALNALFSGGRDEAERAGTDGSLAHFPIVKVKVGRRALAEERRILEVLQAHLPETTRLRLDANRALSLAHATKLFQDLSPERVDYLEEPLSNPSELAQLAAHTGLRMGLDETLHDPPHARLKYEDPVAAWIVKPALIGSWARLRALAEDAEKHGKALVISSALESGLGLWALAQLAAALPAAHAPAGLATDAWLRHDLIEPRFDSRPGFVRTADWVGCPAPQVLERLRFHGVA